jgi:nicotinate-nucleotide adenylyltransferase
MVMNNIALLGGTFDPIHLGHLAIANAIQTKFNFSSFLFLPCRTPVHKGVFASAHHRVEMIKLALQSTSIPAADLCLDEINRITPSYTVETLQQLRKASDPLSITMILGWDAFLGLTSWHHYEKLLSLCHLLVVNRPNADSPLPPEIQTLLQTHLINDPESLKTQAHGFIYLFDAGEHNISSTDLRQRIGKNQSVVDCVPELVWEYIKKNDLYES